jgi:3-oxoacyl-[acyl-carrier-protein] synthase-3
MAVSAHITAIDYYLPEKVVTSAQLKQEFGDALSNSLIQKLGIEKRHVIDEGMPGPELALKAAEKLIENYKIDKASIDGLIYNSMHNYYIIPPTSCLLQHKLGLNTNLYTMDHHHGCSGYTDSLGLARAVAQGLGLKKVLLLTSSALTKYIHPKDKASRVIFGDAGSATLIEAKDTGPDTGLGEFVFGVDGSGYGHIIIKDGGEQNPLGPESFIDRVDDNGSIYCDRGFFMDGEKIMRFILRTVPAIINDILERNNLAMQDIDLFVLHQANNFLNAQIPKLLKADPDKFYNNITFTGNTVQATIPIALKAALDEGKIKPGMKVLVAGFGIGLSWSGTVIRF